ncbi:2875_t:CDS:1, partial [Dentiscutata erythropus]
MTQTSEKIVRYLRSDATPLSDDNIQDIINARNSMKRASEAMAIKYKISTRRVYQIWRDNHPPIDPREVVSQPINIGSISLLRSNDPKGLSKNVSQKNKINNETMELTQPKMSQRLKAQLPQSSTSLCAVKKRVSSIDNTSKRKSDLEKLMKDTERLAPIFPSLP